MVQRGKSLAVREKELGENQIEGAVLNGTQAVEQSFRPYTFHIKNVTVAQYRFESIGGAGIGADE